MKSQNKIAVRETERHRLSILKFHKYNTRLCSRCGKKFSPTGKFCRICEKCNFNPLSMKLKQLKVPNGNYEKVNCANCGKEYVKRKTNGTKQLAPGIRGWRTRTCSKKCARDWRNSGWKRQTKRINTKTSC